MTTDLQRRIFLKGTLATSILSVAAGAGLLAPKQVLAAWPKEAFTAKEMPAALDALLGAKNAE